MRFAALAAPKEQHWAGGAMARVGALQRRHCTHSPVFLKIFFPGEEPILHSLVLLELKYFSIEQKALLK